MTKSTYTSAAGNTMEVMNGSKGAAIRKAGTSDAWDVLLNGSEDSFLCTDEAYVLELIG